MTTNEERRSATIIPFPAGGRAIGGGRRDPMKPAMHHDAPRGATIAPGGAWYHEAAMAEEAEQAREH
ncbi:MAG: DUF2735 domain-containing protein [Pseudolabrys sp.]|jgi:hypothetical protein